MMSELQLASARLSKLWIPFPNHLLDGGYVKKFIRFPYFFFFFNRNFVIYSALILPMSQLQTATDDVTN